MKEKEKIKEYISAIQNNYPSTNYALLREALDYCLELLKEKEFSEEVLKDLEKHEVKKPKTVWDLKQGDVCWKVGVYNEKFEAYQESWDLFVGALRMLGMVHLTKERAELHARVLNTELAIKKWKRENDDVELDWNDENQRKYHFMYDGEDKEIYVDWECMLKLTNTIYFSSILKPQQCVTDIGKERIGEWLKWEDNDR